MKRCRRLDEITFSLSHLFTFPPPSKYLFYAVESSIFPLNFRQSLRSAAIVSHAAFFLSIKFASHCFVRDNTLVLEFIPRTFRTLPTLFPIMAIHGTNFSSQSYGLSTLRSTTIPNSRTLQGSLVSSTGRSSDVFSQGSSLPCCATYTITRQGPTQNFAQSQSSSQVPKAPQTTSSTSSFSSLRTTTLQNCPTCK